jgi:hypothetical protein
VISFSNYRSRLNFVPTLKNARFVKLSLPREKGRFDRAGASTGAGAAAGRSPYSGNLPLI